MSYCNGTTVHVDFARIDVEFLLPRQDHRSKCLIDLNEVDVIHRHARSLQTHSRGRNRSSEHYHGIISTHRHRVDPRSRDESMIFESSLADEQQCRRCVRNLGRGRRSDLPALSKRGESSHLLPVCWTWPLVMIETICRQNLVLESALVARLNRSSMGFDGEHFHVVSTQRPAFRDEICSTELADLLRAIAPEPTNRARERIFESILSPDRSG